MLVVVLTLKKKSEQERQALASQRSTANTIRPFLGGGRTAEPGYERRPWHTDSRHRFMILALEGVRRELISRRKFYELSRLAELDRDEADVFLSAVDSDAADRDVNKKSVPKGRFFFSSRRRHTRWNCDWSSDVCSSD